MRAVKVRMRNGNSRKTAARVNEVNGLLVEQTDAVPENIPGLGLDEDCALSDGDLWGGEYRPDAVVFVVLFELVVVCGLELF